MRIVLLSLLALAACGRVGFDETASGDATSGDSTMPDAFEVLVLDPPFGTPMLVSEISSASFEDDPTLSGDQLEVMFTSARPGGLGGNDLWASSRASVSDPWPTPHDVVELSTAANDTNPELSRDGLSLVYSSGTAGDQDLYFVTRASRAAPWGVATRLTAVSSGVNDFGGAMSDDLAAVYFASARGGSLDIFAARGSAGAWSSPVEITELSTAGVDTSPFVMLDETVMWFASDRPGTAGQHDIWVAIRPSPGAAFDPPLRIGQLATANDDSDPWVSPDGHVIYFSRTTTGTDLYMATR
ncbi:MAG TPA: hypothetical protein VMZ53_08940 [Kofleriaceae bacterium]|nr:hypothetical protein [Kofleriaceae bacterium]